MASKIDFGKAAAEGLDATKRAASARAEMAGVLREASEALTRTFKVELRLSFTRIERDVRRRSVLESIALIPPSTEKVTVLRLAFEQGAEDLADVELDEMGYPVALRWRQSVAVATDRSSFEKAIATLLKSTAAGEKIARLLTKARANPGGDVIPSPEGRG